ncbi:MAG TPA: hypothetical protein PLL30_11335 [Candidatus Krumholzibacteria bacterium]|nr:hypothetical protein [Candidatus Krumholzibacteria bacterium]HPD72357.1 hypothetical protein [Candidatus Krumholzibacteria bacterium]HRY40711.1 hypothetical protein [Candidatus Krumholzibacteria bacterium]
MASAGKKWLIGCGIGCLATVLIVVALVGGAALFFKDIVSSWNTATESESELIRVHGAVADFRPAWDGSVTPERIEIFVAVRDDLAERRGELAAALPAAAAGVDTAATGLEKAWRVLRAGPRLGTLLADFLAARTAALLERGMGLGEYAYLYSLVYIGWLGQEPGAGPEHVEMSFGGRGGGIHYESDDSDERQSRSRRQRAVRRRLNELQQRWFAAMLAQTPPESGPGADARRALVAAEAERLAGSTTAVAWEQGLPEHLAAVLQPWRDRLDDAWCASCNPFELMFLDDGAEDGTAEDAEEPRERREAI